ncbi:MAG: PIN domain-containing protein [Betaproteobacteria bacterium]
MKTNYVLIDFENRPVKSIAMLAAGEQFQVYLFLGKNNTKVETALAMEMQALGDRASYVKLESAGKNVLDFHLAYYIGELAASDPGGFFHVISGDKTFDPLIEHIKGRKIFAARSESIEEMPCFRVAPTPPPAKASIKPAGTSPDDLMEHWIEVVVKELITRGESRPVRMKTLVNTIHARIGKDRSGKEAEAVRDTLVSRRIILLDGVKFTYKLPKAI